MKYLCNKLNISLKNVAYIGDDLNDIDVLKEVAISAMPINSPILKLFKPDYITKTKGGDGAFREFADLIIQVESTSNTRCWLPSKYPPVENELSYSPPLAIVVLASGL